MFVDEAIVDSLEKKMAERGYLEGSEMAGTFNMLRANDLIWSFVVNNYLLGKEPVPVRPAVLEFRCHPHAGEDAHLLSAQHVHRKQSARSLAASRWPASR